MQEHLKKFMHDYRCPGKCTRELYEGDTCFPGNCEYHRQPEKKEEPCQLPPVPQAALAIPKTTTTRRSFFIMKAKKARTSKA